MAGPVDRPTNLVQCIPDGLYPGSTIRFQGSTPKDAWRYYSAWQRPQLIDQRWAINLQYGPNVEPRDDIALHFNVRFHEYCVVRNTLRHTHWGHEERSGGLPFVAGEEFEVVILCRPLYFKISVNGRQFCNYRHRLHYQDITYLTVDGAVTIHSISFEGDTPSSPVQLHIKTESQTKQRREVYISEAESSQDDVTDQSDGNSSANHSDANDFAHDAEGDEPPTVAVSMLQLEDSPTVVFRGHMGSSSAGKMRRERNRPGCSADTHLRKTQRHCASRRLRHVMFRTECKMKLEAHRERQRREAELHQLRKQERLWMVKAAEESYLRARADRAAAEGTQNNQAKAETTDFEIIE